jgi:hypothetical protein
MGEMLRRAGFRVQPIFEVYPGQQHDGISDPEWIRLCGERGWIAVSGDKRLETVPENRQAVIDSKAKIFVLNDSNSPPEVWAAAVIVGHYRMLDLIDGNEGPFFVSIGKRADSHIARLRRPPGFVPPIVDKPSSAEGSPLRLLSENP